MNQAEDERIIAAEDQKEIHSILAELREGMTRIEKLTQEILGDEETN